MKSLKVYRMSHHQNKENAFKQALTSRGWYESRYIRSNSVAFGLFDADWRAGDIEDLKGKPYFLYPHAARPMVQYDGCVVPRKDCRAMFVSAPAGMYLMKKIGYPCEVVEVGWSLTEIRSFRARESVKSICFAPIHPNANGYLNQVDKDLNYRTLERLTEYCHNNGAKLSIRCIGEPELSGLPDVSGCSFIEMHQGVKDSSTNDILKNDLVVAHQTFAYMAVALGVPTVMMGEDIAPRSGNTDDSFIYSANFEKYRDYLAFPLDILNGDPEKVIRIAIEGSEAVEDWKQRFIGKPFLPDYFVDCIEERL